MYRIYIIRTLEINEKSILITELSSLLQDPGLILNPGYSWCIHVGSLVSDVSELCQQVDWRL